DPEINLAVVSVPGAYAARECRAALLRDIHVFLFSDNVSVQDEIRLKDLANARGLLMMGPDCGTAILNGVPLGFANVVRRGNIGIAAASGTGLQLVTALIDTLGAGISQAIGVGGRDLSAGVGGRTMFAALDALKDDPETEVVVLLSKPPAPEVAEKLLEKARNIQKPVVLCLFGRKLEGELGKILLCENIEETAVLAASLSLGRPLTLDDKFYDEAPLRRFLAARRPEQNYVRGIFCGGTLCDEAMVTFRSLGIPIRSNIPLYPDEALNDFHRSEGHTFIDMGDDYFTRGRPHPMIDPGLRNARIVQDALLPDTAAMLLDIELGYGSHPDPAGIAVEAVKEAKARLGGRQVLWIASVVGTAGDPQGFGAQIQKLLDAGFAVSLSNIRAVRLAAQIANCRGGPAWPPAQGGCGE
ncbi:MAG: FdrA family protein, partial [Firmicutes bacterium]|nr:FdrA family protein [Bacillota bacterium]